MYFTASPTVFSFGSSSSGIFTPNFSSAAIATSTIDSESTSRSSTKLFSSLTSDGETSATSSRMVASPSRTSSVLATWFSFLVGFLRWSSGSQDDLAGVRQTRAEAEQQRRRARGHLALLDETRQRERNGRGRGVPRRHDVAGDDRVGRAEVLGDRVDDPQVRLVRHEDGEVVRVDAGPAARLNRDGRHLRGGPAVDGRPLLAEEPRIGVDHD